MFIPRCFGEVYKHIFRCLDSPCSDTLIYSLHKNWVRIRNSSLNVRERFGGVPTWWTPLFRSRYNSRIFWQRFLGFRGRMNISSPTPTSVSYHRTSGGYRRRHTFGNHRTWRITQMFTCSVHSSGGFASCVWVCDHGGWFTNVSDRLGYSNIYKLSMSFYSMMTIRTWIVHGLLRVGR